MLPELPVDKQITLGVIFKDRKKNVITNPKLDGIPEWSTDNSDAVALQPSTDGLSCVVTPVGPLTDTPVFVTFTADADLGEGVKAKVGLFEIQKITAGDVDTVEITGGELEDQPA